jgi:tetratricopeptide (TPR) repeat protein
VDNAEEAVRWLRLALQRNEANANIRSHLGSCLERLGNTADAEAAYNASLTVALSQVGLARLRLAAGDARAALTYVEKATAMDPRDVQAFRLAARVYSALNRPRDAIRALEAAAGLAPRDASIRYQLARGYQAVGDTTKYTRALNEFERLRAIYGVSP